jgi:hypothetical protein
LRMYGGTLDQHRIGARTTADPGHPIRRSAGRGLGWTPGRGQPITMADGVTRDRAGTGCRAARGVPRGCTGHLRRTLSPGVPSVSTAARRSGFRSRSGIPDGWSFRERRSASATFACTSRSSRTVGFPARRAS